MKRILVHNNNKPFSLKTRDELIELLRAKGKEIVYNAPDAIVVIGGDGTMLSAIRRYRKLGVPFIGVDTGTLGFLTTILPDNLGKIFEVLDDKKFRIERYPLLKIECRTSNHDVFYDFAFNEVLIRYEDPKLMEAKIRFDGQPFNYFTGDGFIISTPMGATGYAIWAGGAVVHSSLNVYQVTPLHPNDNSVNRPMKSSIVLPDNITMNVEILKGTKYKIQVACDGISLTKSNVVDIDISVDKEHSVQVLRSDDYDYLALFKRKIIDKQITRLM